MVIPMNARARARLQLAAAVVAAALAPAAGAQEQQEQQEQQGPERVQWPGTLVTVTVPAGFKRTAKGLENDSGALITVGERAAAAHAELAVMFSSPKNLSAGYASQGVTIRSIRQLSVAGAPAPFAIGTQKVRATGAEAAKYLALLKGDKTVLVSFTIPDRSFTEADAEAFVRSIEMAPAPTIDELIAQLPFTFMAVEPFRVTEVRSRTTVTLVAGAEDAGSVDATVVVIGRAAARAEMGQEAQIAVELLQTTPGFRAAVVTSQEPAQFAGGMGYVVRGTVEDRGVVQYVRVVPGGFLMRLIARGKSTNIEAEAEHIAAIAASVD